MHGEMSVKVSKDDLLMKLRENRENHRRVFEEAIIGYRETAVKELDRSLSDARAGRKFKTHFQLVEPRDQTADYDRVIRMLEMSIDTTFEITDAQFECYVMDRWSWSEEFINTANRYTQARS